MRLAYLLTTFPSRTETFAAREIRYLRREGLDIRTFAATADEGAQPDARTEYRPKAMSRKGLSSVWYLASRYPLGFLRLLGRAVRLLVVSPREAAVLASNLHTVGWLARRLDREGIEHLHAYWLSWPACVGAGLAVATGRTLSLSAHARDIFVDGRALEWKLSCARFLVACTAQGLERLRRRLPGHRGKMHLIHHGVEENHAAATSDPLPDQTQPDAEHTVLAVGRLVPKKGFNHLLDAVASLRKQVPAFRALVAGDGPEAGALRAQAERLGLNGSVEFLGWQGHEAVLGLLRSATMLVMPSVVAGDGDRDGIPNVILEAFAAGVPVVATNLDGIAEAVQHGTTGLLVGPGDAAGLADAIRLLLGDAGLRRDLSRQAREAALSRFDASANAGRLARLFREALR